MKEFNPLIGKWNLTGDVQGQIEYGWLEGNKFLIQNVELTYGRKKIKGIEIIGRLQGVSEEPSGEVWSRFYSFLDGLTLDYVYEIDGKTLIIWFKHKDSDNFYKGIFNEDGNSFSGSWQWPGGGYSVVGKRVK